MHLLVEGTFRGAEWRNVKDEGSTIHGVRVSLLEDITPKVIEKQVGNLLRLALLLYIWCNSEITTISIWLIPRGIVIHHGNVNIFADVIISLFFLNRLHPSFKTRD